MLEGNKIYEEPISVKLIRNKSGFNQIDKRWVDNYKELFKMSDEMSVKLKLYCGEIKYNNPTARDSRRLFIDEIKSGLLNEIITFFEQYKKDMISTFFKGNGEGAAKWILVVHKDSDNQKFILKDMEDVIDFYANGDTYVTKNGNMKIGQVSMQRKGGDGG